MNADQIMQYANNAVNNMQVEDAPPNDAQAPVYHLPHEAQGVDAAENLGDEQMNANTHAHHLPANGANERPRIDDNLRVRLDEAVGPEFEFEVEHDNGSDIEVFDFDENNPLNGDAEWEPLNAPREEAPLPEEAVRRYRARQRIADVDRADVNMNRVEVEHLINHPYLLKLELYNLLLAAGNYLPAYKSKCVTLAYLKNIIQERYVVMPLELRYTSTLTFKLPATVMYGLISYRYHTFGGTKALGFDLLHLPDKQYLRDLLQRVYPAFVGFPLKVEDITDEMREFAFDVLKNVAGALAHAGNLPEEQNRKIVELYEDAGVPINTGRIKKLLKSLLVATHEIALIRIHRERMQNHMADLRLFHNVNVDGADLDRLNDIIDAVCADAENF